MTFIISEQKAQILNIQKQKKPMQQLYRVTYGSWLGQTEVERRRQNTGTPPQKKTNTQRIGTDKDIMKSYEMQYPLSWMTRRHLHQRNQSERQWGQTEGSTDRVKQSPKKQRHSLHIKPLCRQ